VTTGDALVAEAQRFAADLTATVRAVVGDHVEAFRARALHRPGLDHVSVHQEPRTGIPLTVDGAPLLNLTAEFYCVWDSPGQFLAVDESAVKVYAGAKAAGEPLFRYEYTRATSGDVPRAHVQIHGHRDALAFVMTRAGSGSPRGQQLAGRVAQGTAVPRMSDLHFPVGGTRFRPALEDVLDMLVRELGVDHERAWRDALADGRERWRRMQTAAVVRDAPAEAIAALTALGYDIQLRDGTVAPQDNRDRLREL
jgi:hypothetical protein